MKRIVAALAILPAFTHAEERVFVVDPAASWFQIAVGPAAGVFDRAGQALYTARLFPMVFRGWLCTR